MMEKTQGLWWNVLWAILFLAVGVMFLGCSSDSMTIVPTPPAKYVKLGEAKGKGSGSIGFFTTTYHFIPIGMNERVQTAYANALKSVPEATSLTEVTYREDWHWSVIGTTRTVTITGEAIREVR
jgi:hypothetical protein